MQGYAKIGIVIVVAYQIYGPQKVNVVNVTIVETVGEILHTGNHLTSPDVQVIAPMPRFFLNTRKNQEARIYIYFFLLFKKNQGNPQ